MQALIIEDNPNLLTMWRMVLEQRGAWVHPARDVQSAEHLLTHEAHFDVILSDLHLGDAAALGLLDYARIRHPDATIVLVTGTQIYTHGELHALAPAADWILRKPVPVSDLEAVLDYLHRPAGRVRVAGGGRQAGVAMPGF